MLSGLHDRGASRSLLAAIRDTFAGKPKAVSIYVVYLLSFLASCFLCGFLVVTHGLQGAGRESGLNSIGSIRWSEASFVHCERRPPFAWKVTLSHNVVEQISIVRIGVDCPSPTDRH